MSTINQSIIYSIICLVTMFLWSRNQDVDKLSSIVILTLSLTHLVYYLNIKDKTTEEAIKANAKYRVILLFIVSVLLLAACTNIGVQIDNKILVLYFVCCLLFLGIEISNINNKPANIKNDVDNSSKSYINYAKWILLLISSIVRNYSSNSKSSYVLEYSTLLGYMYLTFKKSKHHPKILGLNGIIGALSVFSPYINRL